MVDLDKIMGKIRHAIFRDQVGLFPDAHDYDSSEDLPFRDLSKTDKEYVTNTPFPFNISEQGAAPLGGLPGGTPFPPPGPSMAGAGGMPGGTPTPEIPTSGGMAMTPGEMQMGMTPDMYQKDPETIGRIYELKKIYSRLLAIEGFLSTACEEVLIKLREYVTKAIELFEVLIENINTFTANLDKLNHIIVLFYKLLDSIYDILRNYLKAKASEGK
jgi:hypothetical protein